MTLIVKELVIRGIVTQDPKKQKKETVDTKLLKKHLDHMEKAIKKDCIEAVLSKLESRKTR